MMYSTGSTFGRFELHEDSGALIFVHTSSRGKELVLHEVDCSDLKTARSLIGAIGEDLQVSFEFLSNMRIRILQAQRLPEQAFRNLAVTLYFSKNCYIQHNSRGTMCDVYIINENFVKNNLWIYADKDDPEVADDEKNLSSYDQEMYSELSKHRTKVRLPADYVTVFNSNRDLLAGKVVKPRGGRYVVQVGKFLTMELGMELHTSSIADLVKSSETHALPEAARFERKVPPSLRRKVMLRDGHKCVDCGANPATDPFVSLEVDHRVPISKGGSNDMDNLQTLLLELQPGQGCRNRPQAQQRPLGRLTLNTANQPSTEFNAARRTNDHQGGSGRERRLPSPVRMDLKFTLRSLD